MDIVELDHSEHGFEETSTENSVDPDSSDSTDTFGEQELLPRVGDEYQAAIPTMLTPSELLKYFSSPYDSQHMFDVSYNLLIGLPVPITWVNKEAAIKDEAVEVRDEDDFSITDPKQRVAQNYSASEKKKSNIKGDCLDQRRVINGCSAVPGLSADPWSESEVDSFLLGLYIFGKNLLQVKIFMESKEMGQILSFYYGRFFRSDKYRRWADCRKTKGRKCIIGQRLLIGSRQQELFSRLLPRLSDESRNTSLEAYKAFTDARTSLEEYVSTLKNMVGIHALVEAVAIGKVSEDLTAMAMEPSRTNHTPSGKACSDLTYEEIIKYVTGDLRLSKARSSDLFWEAVWPRLLAKGWHSEMPKNEAYRGSRDCLVFIVPGIKKFRRKLLKGDHYFDSVSDVLKKVASEPGCLMLETEENGTKISEKGNGFGTAQNSDEDGGSDHDHNRYLKPRFSSSETANHMKFTIVDTSLFHEDEPSKVRELRSLPAEKKNASSAGVHTSRIADVRVCADEVGDPEKATDLSDKLRDYVIHNRSKDRPSGGGKKRTTHNSFDPPQKPVKNPSDHCNVHLSADKQPKSVKHKAEHRVTYAQSECIDPVVKRKKLRACSKAETVNTVGDFSKPLIVSQDNLILRLPAPSKKPVQRRDSHSYTRNGPTCSFVADNHGEKNNNGDSNQGSCSSATSNESYEKAHLLIDLNEPQALVETEVNGQVVKVKAEESSDSTRLESSKPVGGSTVDGGLCSDEQANGNARRHGSRIRPMSTKALEALESSFFKTKKEKKRSSEDAQDPRTCRRPRAKSSIPGNCTVDAVMDSKAMEPSGIHNAVNDVLADTLT